MKAPPPNYDHILPRNLINVYEKNDTKDISHFSYKELPLDIF